MSRRTPLNTIHKQLGARMVDFAGWEMPVLYQGVIEEHRAVRTKAGIFDVSHMGEIEVQGPQAEAILQRLTCNDVARLKPGDCQYSAFLTEKGTFVDDIIVNRLGADHFIVCINASNIEKDFEAVRSFATGDIDTDTKITNRSDDFFQIALQGPDAEKILLGARFLLPLPQKPFTLVQTKFSGRDLIISRTGYTGEDGFEIYGSPADAESIWNLLMEKGATPCGLGTRDTLRLEAAYPLYGHEIDETIHPFEARLGWIVKMDKGHFIGREALSKIVESQGLQKVLVGIVMQEPGIARQSCKVYKKDQLVGRVTSGTHLPTLDLAVALAYLQQGLSTVGTKIQVDIHNQKREAMVVSLPFYRRK